MPQFNFDQTRAAMKTLYPDTPDANAPPPKFSFDQPTATPEQAGPKFSFDGGRTFWESTKERFSEAVQPVKDLQSRQPTIPEKGETGGDFARRAFKRDLPEGMAAVPKLMSAAAAPATAPLGAAGESAERAAALAAGVKPEQAEKLARDTGDVTENLVQVLGVAEAPKIPKAADVVTGAADRAIQPARKVFSPATVSPQAERAAMVKRKAVGEATRDTKASIEAIAPYEKRFDTLTPEEREAFPKFMENRSFITGDEKIASPAIEDQGQIYTGKNHDEIRKSMPKDSNKGAEANTGFVTSTGRFVDRKAADRIAKAQGQFSHEVKGPDELHSQELKGYNQSPRLKFPQDLQDAAKVLNEGYKLRESKLKETKSLKDTGVIENYLNRNAVWDDPKKQQQFNKIMFGKQGKGGNVRQRKYPTFEEFASAVKESGGRLQDENFMRSAAYYYANMDNYIAHNRAFDQLKDDKLIKYSNKQGRVPEGYVPLQGRLSEKIGVTKDGRPIVQQAYAPEDVARVYNNFISKDFMNEGGGVLRKTRMALNAITSLKLGLANMWHAGIVSSAAVSSDLAKGTRQLLTPGMRAKGAASILKSPVAMRRLERVGEKYHKQYLKLTDDAQAEKLIKLATKANIISTKRPSYMNMTGGRMYEEMFDPVKLAGLDPQAQKIGARIGRTMQKLTSNMMDKWIPDMKTGAAVERLQLWLEQNPEATEKEQEMAAAKIGDAMDNRFGEMMLNNLFWHKTLLNALRTGFISAGWVTGAARLLKGTAEETYGTIRHGKEVGLNTEYLLANAVVAATAASVYQYLHTGKMPQEPKDLIWPQTGGTQFVGSNQEPERAALPTGHWTQFAEYMHDPLQELENEGNIGAKAFLNVATNRDYRGLPIAKPWALWQDNFPSELGDAAQRYLAFIGGQALTPIAINSYMKRNAGTGITPQETIGAGARPAPAFISAPEETEHYDQVNAQKLWTAKQKADARAQGKLESNQPETPTFNFAP